MEKAKEVFFKVIKSPKILTYILIGILIIFVIVVNKDYGITWDELIQRNYGNAVYYWYKTFGKDTSFLHQTLWEIYYYGPFYEVLLIGIEHLFKHVDPWYLRNLVTGFVGVLGVYVTALCGFEIDMPWVGFTGALLLTLFPRYLGDINANTKDIPFLVVYTIVLYFVLRLIKRWKTQYIKESIFVGIALGISLAIRDISLLWLVTLPVIAFLYWTFSIHTNPSKKVVFAQLKKQIISFAIITGISIALMTLLWPYVLMDPIPHFEAALNYMSHFPTGVVLFAGQYINNGELPWNYTLIWLFITTPLISLAAIGAGLVTLWYKSAQQIFKEAYIGIIFLACAIPLLSIIVLRSTLYNAIRQFIFVVPAMLLLGAYGLITACTYLIQHKHQTLLYVIIGIFILGNLFTIKEIYHLYPYEYVYYNSIVGGVHGANNKYELDYWGQCYKAAGEWLSANYTTYTKTKTPTLLSQIGYQTIYYMSKNFSLAANPDFFIYNVYANFNTLYPTYTVIHTISVDKTDLCRITMRPGLR